jgi:hypothetical protein
MFKNSLFHFISTTLWLTLQPKGLLMRRFQHRTTKKIYQIAIDPNEINIYTADDLKVIMYQTEQVIIYC